MRQTVVMFDLDIYDCILPVQPVNKFHYIGIDINGRVMGKNLVFFTRLTKNRRKWANFYKEHYALLEIAKRFLNILKFQT